MLPVETLSGIWEELGRLALTAFCKTCRAVSSCDCWAASVSGMHTIKLAKRATRTEFFTTILSSTTKISIRQQDHSQQRYGAIRTRYRMKTIQIHDCGTRE